MSCCSSTSHHVLPELQYDVCALTLYLGPQLTVLGFTLYLQEAETSHTARAVTQLRQGTCFCARAVKPNLFVPTHICA